MAHYVGRRIDLRAIVGVTGIDRKPMNKKTPPSTFAERRGRNREEAERNITDWDE
jgi:hypothetical protein